MSPVTSNARRALPLGGRTWAGTGRWQNRFLRLRWHMVRALTPRRVVHARGLRFTLQCENWITQYRWQTYNEKEPETLDWIDQWVQDGDTVLDVGANIGVYALYAALRHPGAQIVAIEPEYANLHLLRDNILDNGLQDRVQVYGIALGNRTGISQLHIQDATPGSALHTEATEALARTLTGRPVVWREGITVMTLDAFCEQTGLHPQAIKLDVDGTELRILDGAKRTLASPTLRSVLVEVAGEPSAGAQCEQRLVASGLRCAWRDPCGKGANQMWARVSS